MTRIVPLGRAVKTSQKTLDLSLKRLASRLTHDLQEGADRKVPICYQVICRRTLLRMIVSLSILPIEYQV